MREWSKASSSREGDDANGDGQRLTATGVEICDARVLSARPDEAVEAALRAPLLSTSDPRPIGRSTSYSTGTRRGDGSSSSSRAGDAPWALPSPVDRSLARFVREAWPSPTTGVTMTEGILDAGMTLTITVASDRLVVFGDGIEADRCEVPRGQRIDIGIVERTLSLAVP